MGLLESSYHACIKSVGEEDSLEGEECMRLRTGWARPPWLIDRMRPGPVRGCISISQWPSPMRGVSLAATGMFQSLLSPVTSVRPNEVLKILNSLSSGVGGRRRTPVCKGPQI